MNGKAWVHVPKELRGKLDKRSKETYLVGYAKNGYRLWEPTEQKIVIARSVIFNEKNPKQNNNIQIFEK